VRGARGQLVGQPRVAQRVRDLRLVDDRGQLRARSSGMVPTAMPPALITPNQQAASIGVLAPRSSTRLPGTRPMSSHQHVGDAVGRALQLGIGPAPSAPMTQGARPRRAPPGGRAARRRSSARRELQLGQLEQELGQASRRRQPVAREGVDVGAGMAMRYGI
jgi:hypothetical protein